MRLNDLTRLDASPVRENNIVDFMQRLAKDRTVLNVGAAGGVLNYLPDNRDIWLHHKIGVVAREVVGVDIDDNGIAHASRHGVEILRSNCETMNLGRHFDLIVLSDVIEHLEAPVTGVRNLMRHLSRDGHLLITTPNPTSFSMIVRSLTGRRPNVYYDHVTCFMPEHIQGICDRHGYHAERYLFFDHADKRNLKLQIKSIASRLITSLNPRLATSFLAIIRHGT